MTDISGMAGKPECEQPANHMTVYKQLSADMRDGLKNIYQQISTASNADLPPRTDLLFTEASDQLDEVVKTTEQAAMTIMEVVEKQLELTQESSELIERLKKKNDAADLARLAEINAGLQDDLTSVITALSFQDLTGQRIKKVVAALNSIETSVVELYLSSGLVMDGAEKDPQKDAQTLQAEAQQAMRDFSEKRKVVSELKGPDKNGVSQSAIDDMLAQLGL